MKVFIDLEETVIDDWHTRNFLPEKIRKIRDFLEKNGVREVTLFSMAVWTKKDVDEFNRQLREPLERLFGVERIVATPLSEDLQAIARKANISTLGGAIFFTDLFPFRPKETFFEEVFGTKDGVFILFDDTVEDKVILKEKTQIVFKKI